MSGGMGLGQGGGGWAVCMPHHPTGGGGGVSSVRVRDPPPWGPSAHFYCKGGGESRTKARRRPPPPRCILLGHGLAGGGGHPPPILFISGGSPAPCGTPPPSLSAQDLVKASALHDFVRAHVGISLSYPQTVRLVELASQPLGLGRASKELRLTQRCYALRRGDVVQLHDPDAGPAPVPFMTGNAPHPDPQWAAPPKPLSHGCITTADSPRKRGSPPPQVSAGVGKPPHRLGGCIWMPLVNGTGQQPRLRDSRPPE